MRRFVVVQDMEDEEGGVAVQVMNSPRLGRHVVVSVREDQPENAVHTNAAHINLKAAIRLRDYLSAFIKIEELDPADRAEVSELLEAG